MTIPTPLDADYRIATSHDVRSWSFGALTSPRHASATYHDNVFGTLHDQRIEAANNQTATRIREIITSIIDQLVPVVITAHNWRLAASRTLSRGLALKHKDATADLPEYCPQCGYLLAGLQVVLCPGCGSQVE